MDKTHLTVAAVVETRGRFLVVEETAGGLTVLNQPAGHVEPGETFRDAIVREVLEETAWHFVPTAINGVYLWHHPVSGERFLRVTFSGTCRDHEAHRKLDDGIIRTLWLSREELLMRGEQLRSPMVLRAVDDYRGGVRFPVNMFQQLDLEDLASHAQQVV
jgi:8-oxo-dGTP pyrophosphatase MutT (NUDIX family)